jgi:hydrogenase/urease accessory protein HupE
MKFTPHFFLLLAFACSARAHDPGLSTGEFKLTATQATCQLTFARMDVEGVVKIDTDGDGQASAAEMAIAQPRLDELAKTALEFRTGDQPVPAQKPRAWLDETNNIHFEMVFPFHAPKQITFFSALIKKMSPNHRQFVVLLDKDGQALAEALLSASQDVMDVDVEQLLAGEVPSHTFRDFLREGVHHILVGYDHLLFLFALLLVTSRFKAAAIIITCFTLAHSITLALATLKLVSLRGGIVEPLIAATIVYVGAENLMFREGPRWRWLLTFTFGLIHGLGFASVLSDMGVSSGGGGITMPLLAFNLGVELGQLAIAAVVLPIILWLRRYPVFVNRVAPALSVVVMLLGAWWLLERTVLS